MSAKLSRSAMLLYVRRSYPTMAKTIPYRLRLNDKQETELNRSEWIVYLQAGLIRQSKKSKKFARVNDRFYAYRCQQTDRLLFFAKDKTIQRYSIPSQFRYILELLKFQVRHDKNGPIYEWAWAIQDQVYRSA